PAVRPAVAVPGVQTGCRAPAGAVVPGGPLPPAQRGSGAASGVVAAGPDRADHPGTIRCAGGGDPGAESRTRGCGPVPPAQPGGECARTGGGDRPASAPAAQPLLPRTGC